MLGKESSYFIKSFSGILQTKDGIIDRSKLRKAKEGKKVETHLGKVFYVVEPRLTDFLAKAKRLQQVILPKDAAMILAFTGIGQGCEVIDVGCGSGWLSIFLAYYVKPGNVYTYEIDKRAIKVARENIENSGLKNIVLKERDATKGLDEKNVDLVTIDMKDATKVIKHAFHSLKIGGWLVVYSPYVEQVIDVRKEMKKYEFSYIRTIENVVREWQMTLTFRPKSTGLMHTGFLTFARKVG